MQSINVKHSSGCFFASLLWEIASSENVKIPRWRIKFASF